MKSSYWNHIFIYKTVFSHTWFFSIQFHKIVFQSFLLSYCINLFIIQIPKLMFHNIKKICFQLSRQELVLWIDKAMQHTKQQVQWWHVHEKNTWYPVQSGLGRARGQRHTCSMIAMRARSAKFTHQTSDKLDRLKQKDCLLSYLLMRPALDLTTAGGVGGCALTGLRLAIRIRNSNLELIICATWNPFFFYAFHFFFI